MSPLIFLAIPVVVFIVGSTVLMFASRARHDRVAMRKTPDELRTVVPMLRDQREVGWPVGSGGRSTRS